jgi:Flp pilus assembly protein TadG
MRQNLRSLVGATLLEVMLVLSIIALIILMSIRYYQAANNASQSEQVLALIEAITATAENITSGTSGGYTASTLNSANITNLGGTSILKAPNGGTITVTPSTSTTYAVVIPVVSNVCALVKIKISSNPKYTVPTCTGSSLTYTYNSTM